MKRRVIGIIFILFSLVLAGLQLIPIIEKKSNVLLDEHGIPLIFLDTFREIDGTATYAAKNVTLTPLGNPDNVVYEVDVLVIATVWNSSKPNNYTLIDFWVVNQTGALLFRELLNESSSPYIILTDLIRDGTIPSLPGIKTYAQSVDKAIIPKKLSGLDYNGNYTFILVNPYREVVANVSILVEEVKTVYMHIVKPSFLSILGTGFSAIVGLYLLIKKPRVSKRLFTKRMKFSRGAMFKAFM
jgi:hypothetical protein